MEAKAALNNTIGNPLETTVFSSHLTLGGTLDKFPGLKIAVAHAGGYLPFYLGRSDARCGRGGGKGVDCTKAQAPAERILKNGTSMSIRWCSARPGCGTWSNEVGVDHIVYGTDFPFDWPVGIDSRPQRAFLSNAEKEAILGGNLIKLLRINASGVSGREQLPE